MSFIAPVDLSSASNDSANAAKAESLGERARGHLKGNGDNGDNALWKVATGFEEIFINMMLKTMRKTTMDSGLIGSDNGSRIYKDMFDSEVAGLMAGRKDMGLSRIIHHYLGAKLNNNEPEIEENSTIKEKSLESNGDNEGYEKYNSTGSIKGKVFSNFA